MSGRKSNLQVYPLVVAQSMAASFSSPVTNIIQMDNIGIQVNYTGAPVGTFIVEVSSDYNVDNNGNVINAGNWIPLTLSGTPTAAGSADQIYININQVPAPFVRFSYARTSGTGSCNGFISGKMI